MFNIPHRILSYHIPVRGSLYALVVNVMLCLQGNVESWLAELLTVTRLSVHDIIRSASIAITDTNFNLLEFEKVFPAQVCFFIVVYRRLLVISFIIIISFFYYYSYTLAALHSGRTPVFDRRTFPVPRSTCS